MNRIKPRHGATPDRMQVDNGSEFISTALDRWAYDHDVTLDVSRPGRPKDNPYIESFNGSFRDECLNVHWFLSLDDDRTKIETWRRDDNAYRPHQSLDGYSPEMYLDARHSNCADSLPLTG
jgi:putative transposase